MSPEEQLALTIEACLAEIHTYSSSHAEERLPASCKSQNKPDYDSSASGKAAEANLSWLRDLTKSLSQSLSHSRLGDFEISREIGRGRMAIVYEATQRSRFRQVALKVLPFASLLSSIDAQRLQNELCLATDLKHPNIVSIHSVDCVDRIHFFTMELIEGKSIAQLIRDRQQFSSASNKQAAFIESREQFKKPFKEKLGSATHISHEDQNSLCFYQQVANWGLQAALALECAHSTGMLHGNIRPSNLFIDDAGILRVSDFGLKSLSSSLPPNLLSTKLNSFVYASPEETRGATVDVDHRSDIYSLGTCLYELISLQPVFSVKNRLELMRGVIQDSPRLLRKVAPSVPKSLETIVHKMLTKRPSRRYASAGDLAEDLQRFLEGRPIKTRRPLLASGMASWILRRFRT